MIQAVIFDLDGTLVDSNELHVEAWSRAFRHFGKTFTREQLHQQVGKGADQYLPVFLNAQELREIGPAIDRYRSDLFKNEFLPAVRPFPKVRELFERIRGDGKRIALASSGKGEEVRVYKKICKIEDLVDAETTSDDAQHSKPAPDVFEASLRKLGGPAPDEVIAVGDTPYDAEAVRKSGISAIGVLCGGFPGSQLRNAGMIALYRDPADLLRHYETSPIARR